MSNKLFNTPKPCEVFYAHHRKQRMEFCPSLEGHVATQMYHSRAKNPIQLGVFSPEDIK